MLITSHFFFTVLISKLLSLTGLEFYFALIAGVAVDIEHLFVNNKWIRDVKNFFQLKKIEQGVNQHSLLQEPLFGISTALLVGIILHFTLTIRWWISPLFLASHIFFDALMKFSHYPWQPFNKFHYRGFIPSGTRREFYISIVALIILFIFY